MQFKIAGHKPLKVKDAFRKSRMEMVLSKTRPGKYGKVARDEREVRGVFQRVFLVKPERKTETWRSSRRRGANLEETDDQVEVSPSTDPQVTLGNNKRGDFNAAPQKGVLSHKQKERERERPSPLLPTCPISC